MLGKIYSGMLTKKHESDAGQDIRASETVIVLARDSVVVHTDLVIGVPVGCVGLIWSRSGLSVKHNIEVGAGCIDSSYRGEILVHLYNHGDYDYTINRGDRIAQLLTIPIIVDRYVQSVMDEQTVRGTAGFGSTGK